MSLGGKNMEYINIIAIISGPVFAVCITLWWQDRKEKRNAKMNLFMTLMSYRKALLPLNQEWVNALNLIDVVFGDNRKVVTLWHEYHEMFYRKDRDFAGEDRKHLDLLYEIARELGYENLQQTDIDRFYAPRGIGDQSKLNEEIQQENLKYLKNINKIYEQQTTSDDSTQ